MFYVNEWSFKQRTMFQIRRICFSNRLTITKLSYVFGTAVSSRIGRAIATFLNFYVSHRSATKFLRNGEKYCISFIDNLLLFPRVKEFSKLVDSWWSYRKKFDTTFFSGTQCSSCGERKVIFAFSKIVVLRRLRVWWQYICRTWLFVVCARKAT